MRRWDAISAELTDPRNGAEIGVKEGRFIEHQLKTFPDLVMVAVDPWEDQPGANEDYIGWDWRQIYQEYRQRTEHCRDRIIELKHYSVTAAPWVEDGWLDFVFIDAQHDYESVKQDIELWTPKVRKGGFISGHDYNPKFPGVIQAVNEAFGEPDRGADYVWLVQI